MAGKGRRTASRQAQLNRKRKKTQKGPSGIPSTARRVADSDVEEAVAVSAGVQDAELEAPEAPETTVATGLPAVPISDVPAAPRASRPSRVAARTPRGEFAGQGQGRLRGERPAAYLYVGAEFRRIMVLAGAILTILIVLGIIL